MSLSWLEKAMATHSSTLAWKIPWMEEPGHNLNDLAVAAAALSWWWYCTINLQAAKCPSSQGYAFSSGHVSTGIHVSSGCESWTVKKAEHWRIDAFELWCWRRLLRVPWTARRSNQSILKEISPGVHWKDWCWSWNSNTLATWCEELTHWKRPWCWEGLRAGGEGDDRGWDGWMASPTRWMWVWVNSGSWWWTGRPGMLRFTGSQRVGHDWATELNWTELLW